MNQTRALLLQWLRDGTLDADVRMRALRVSGLAPTEQRWQVLLDRLLLAFASAFLLSGITTFFAANWQAMGRFGRMGLVVALLLIALAAAWRLRLTTLVGKAALFAAAVLVGVLLAVIGQTYQTGADTYELFLAWSLFILPWAWLGNFAPLWLLWIALVNLSLLLYFDVHGVLFGLVTGTHGLFWTQLLGNGALLLIVESTAGSSAVGSSRRWITRVLILATLLPATWLAVDAVIDRDVVGGPGLLVWVALLLLGLWVYRWVRVDIFALAGGLLSLMVVVTSGLARALLGHNGDEAGLLLIALLIIGMSAGSGWWLKRVVAETGGE